MFGRATITLGIGPHSSLLHKLQLEVSCSQKQIFFSSSISFTTSSLFLDIIMTDSCSAGVKYIRLADQTVS